MSTNHEESFEILWARPRLEVIDLPSFISFVKKTNEKCKFLATFYKFRRKQLLPVCEHDCLLGTAHPCRHVLHHTSLNLDERNINFCHFSYVVFKKHFSMAHCGIFVYLEGELYPQVRV